MAVYDSEKSDALLPGVTSSPHIGNMPSLVGGGGGAADAGAVLPHHHHDDDNSVGRGVAAKKKAKGQQKERVGWAILVALLALALLFVGLFVRSHRADCPQPFLPSSAASSTVVIPHYLGDTLVNITVETRPQGPLAGVAFLNLHSNENTSVVAVRALQYYHGGSLTKLQHRPVDRLITFSMGGGSDQANNFTFDPNRMFTDVGIDATLRANGNWSAAAAREVKSFARAVLDAYAFDTRSTVIGIHNNGPGYSADHYLPGGDMANDSSSVYIAPGSNSHNFFFVTTQPLYDLIAGLGLNVVLQSSTTDATDDGSLSYYCALRGVQYVNVEARAEGGDQGDQVVAQLDMFQRFTHAYFLSSGLDAGAGAGADANANAAVTADRKRRAAGDG